MGFQQQQSFTHLLGDKDTTIPIVDRWNRFDFKVKTLSEVYIPESRRQIFIITIPHTFRRTWFDDDGVILQMEVKEKVSINEYNNYYNFLHNYELVNRFVGRDKIIWGTWDMDLPHNTLMFILKVFDYTNDKLSGSEIT